MLALHLSAPAVQAVVPAAQTPGRPLAQATPPPGFPLSTTPLQSLSLLSQTSAVGALGTALQTPTPALQTRTPALAHSPTPLEHAAPTLKPLSTVPSQLSSSPLQVSVCVPTAMVALHLSAPAVQAVVPAAQTPGRPLAQATPPPGFPLSTVPSQLLSMPSHTSAVGIPAVTLQTVTLGPPQTLVPEAWQAPTPTVQAAPKFAHCGTLMVR